MRCSAVPACAKHFAQLRSEPRFDRIHRFGEDRPVWGTQIQKMLCVHIALTLGVYKIPLSLDAVADPCSLRGTHQSPQPTPECLLSLGESDRSIASQHQSDSQTLSSNAHRLS